MDYVFKLAGASRSLARLCLRLRLFAYHREAKIPFFGAGHFQKIFSRLAFANVLEGYGPFGMYSYSFRIIYLSYQKKKNSQMLLPLFCGHSGLQ